MCGIAGFINKEVDAVAAISSMNAQMEHRGPDSGGYWTDENSGLTLGHRRLAILDLTESGAQPMHSADKRYVMVYNGEIYNAPDMREELCKRDPALTFRGSSDTEVILEAFSLFGIFETLKMMKGMFAIALYDCQERTLYLMRDRVGEKPLYYGFVNGHFVFGSEIRVLEAYPEFAAHRRINRSALAEYMRYGYIPAPLSVYEGIYKLLPGECMTVKAPFQKYCANSYWSMEECALKGERHPFQGSFDEACNELDLLLTSAVSGQLLSDVPVGAFLSGGIDSALIVSLMQKVSKAPVKTFTIGFTDKKYNEAEFAKTIAGHLGTEHTELYVSEQDLLDVIPKLSDIFSEPFADSSQIPTYLVSRLAKSRVTVTLSGDAGDELFGGYRTYQKVLGLWNRISGIPYGIRKGMGGALGVLAPMQKLQAFRSAQALKAADIAALHEAVCYHTDYWGECCVITESDRTEAEKTGRGVPESDVPRALYDIRKGNVLRNEVSAMLLKDMLTYHPDDILVKVDRCGMAVSLENRVPMLDRDVVEFAWKLPSEYKIGAEAGDIGTKRILKEILYRYVPKEMMDRPKKGFSVPMTRWLSEGTLREWAGELITDSALVRDGYFDRRALDRIYKDFLANRRGTQTLWQILMAEEWYRKRS
ncbi:MAG: asparagine synthase (glutamine-hydrolyzing) [Lachnospiraceae bacterium]|nr:asparagine synthase (glutamine-hydrolyzing) [Lachnospiraceae bacterium]